MPLVKSNISVIHCIIFVPFCFPCRPLCRSLTACSMRRVNAPPTAKPPSATSYRRGAYRAFSSTLNKLESGIHSAKCTSFQGSTVPPRQELGLLQKATVDVHQETGRVCYPVHQFRCLLAETVVPGSTSSARASSSSVRTGPVTVAMQLFTRAPVQNVAQPPHIL